MKDTTIIFYSKLCDAVRTDNFNKSSSRFTNNYAICLQSIIYYTMQSAKLEEWLSSPSLTEALKPMSERSFVDLDPIFNVNLDEDYDFRASGITR